MVFLLLFLAALSASGIAALLLRAPVSTEPAARAPLPWHWLLPLLAVAAILRALHLDSGLWYDEVITLVEFVPPARRRAGHQLQGPRTTHILYSLCAHGAIAVFGESAWTLRLPAVVFGVASLGALYLLATGGHRPPRSPLGHLVADGFLPPRLVQPERARLHGPAADDPARHLVLPARDASAGAAGCGSATR